MATAKKITGDDLRELGWTPGPIFRDGLRAAKRAHRRHLSRDVVLTALAEIWSAPEKWTDDPVFGRCARTRLEMIRPAVVKTPMLRDEPLECPTWGREGIDSDAIAQMERACRLPITVGAALMADAHVGYGVPIGGVVATRGAVLPYAVGMDIACRMCLSVVDLPAADLTRRRVSLRGALRQETAFGVGAQFPKRRRREHAVLDVPDWQLLEMPDRERLRDLAWAQLGTSGAGNHFVEFGEIELNEEVGGLGPGRHLALLSHSGSRGLGAKIASHFTRVAMDRCRLPREMRHLAWLPLDTAEGQAYWQAMTLAGDFAQANHACIHRHVLNTAGLEAALSVENHHNFAWVEEHGGEEVVVHRKGATPAAKQMLGIIPGSMATPGFLVRGLGEPASLHSAAHGAGRRMSRGAAKKSLSREVWQETLARADVELLGGGLDEAPQAYKPIREVMRAQSDLVEIIATFHPRLVLMSDEK